MVGERFMDRGDKVGSHPRFRNIAEPSLGEAPTHKCRVLMNCQENKLGPRSSLVQCMCGFNSGEYWHPDIQYNHIWLKPLCFAHQGLSIINGSDHVKVRL